LALETADQAWTLRLRALGQSIDQLAKLVAPLSAEDLTAPAYPAEWTIAPLLSHVGSGAAITRLRLSAALEGREVDFAEMREIWDEWNAKAPERQAADALIEDQRALQDFSALTPDQRGRIHLPLRGEEFDDVGLIESRLYEHVLHTWDLAVTFDPAATLQDDAVEFLLDGLTDQVRRFAQTTPIEQSLTARTVTPDRTFEIATGPAHIALRPTEPGPAPDLELPGESLVRLVYGRLDADHTPAEVSDPRALLDPLRTAFPGV
jgi:uncharacterized protein (TIGR03083 family)